jgi:uncharacterized membrane protein
MENEKELNELARCMLGAIAFNCIAYQIAKASEEANIPSEQTKEIISDIYDKTGLYNKIAALYRKLFIKRDSLENI